MDTYVNGDFSIDECGCVETVSSIDEACQRVRFILSTFKGSFIYDRDFGADFSPIFHGDFTEGEENNLAWQLCREALVKENEISVEDVTVSHIDGDWFLRLKVVFDELEKYLEVKLL